MAEEVNMVEYTGEEARVMELEDGFPADDDLPPLSQVLIPPDLASAFNIKPEPYRTPIDVNQASQNTLSSLRGSQPMNVGRIGFKPFNESNGSREEMDDDRSGSKKLRRTESVEETDSAMRGGENLNSNSNSVDDQSARTLKRPRLVWTPQLHKRFVDVVSHLGIKNAVPKTIMQLMNVEGLTRENVASHLQKYRLYLKRMQGLSNEGPSSSDQLFASTPVPQNLRDSGHTNGHVPVPIPMPYVPGPVPYPMLGMAPHHSHGHVAVPMGGYKGMEAHHQHGFGIVQRRSWSGNYNVSSVSYLHVAPGDK